MARGYPDFFGFSIFPQFGTLTEEDSGLFAIVTGNTQTLFTITQKGKSYGGILRYNGQGDVHLKTQAIVIVDGVTISDEVPAGQIHYGYYVIPNQFINLVDYHITDTYEYVVFNFGTDFSWGKSVVVNLENTSGMNIAGQCWYWWAKVI